MSTLQHVIFWRHAEAEDAAAHPDDLRRALTRDGRRDASAMAAWIKAHVPKPWTVCCSPALRSRQTALALADYPVEQPGLAPDASADDILALLARPDEDGSALVLCGHQPSMGSAALQWLSGARAPFTLRKGALIWVCERQRDGSPARVLRAAISPELLD